MLQLQDLASASMASTQHDAAHDAAQLLRHSVATDAEIVADCFDPRINLSSCTTGNAQGVSSNISRKVSYFKKKITRIIVVYVRNLPGTRTS